MLEIACPRRVGATLRRVPASSSEPSDAETVVVLVVAHLYDASSFAASRSTSTGLIAMMLVSRAIRDGVVGLLARQAAVGPSRPALRAFYLSPTLSALSPGLLQLLRLRIYGTIEDQQLAYAILSYAPCLQHLELDMLEAPGTMLLDAVAAVPLRTLELRQRAACPAIVQLVPRLDHLRRLVVDAQCGATSLRRIVAAVCTRRGVALEVESDAV